METINFECSICYSVCVRPQTLFPCRHINCLDCTEKWQSVQRSQQGDPHLFTCPTCRTPVQHYETNLDLQQKLLEAIPDEYNRRLQILDENNLSKQQRKESYSFRRALCTFRILVAFIIGAVISTITAVSSSVNILLIILVFFSIPFMAKNRDTWFAYIRGVELVIENVFWFLDSNRHPTLQEVTVLYVTAFGSGIVLFICNLFLHLGM